MKKSLMIVTEAFELGGVETHIADEIRVLSSLGWEVHLVCGHRFSSLLVPDEVATVTNSVGLGAEADIAEFLSAVDTLKAIAVSNDVSIIHAHPFTSKLVAAACAQALQIPLCVTLHGPSSIVGSYGPAYDFMMGAMVLPAASRVIVVSEELARLLEPMGGRAAIQTMPNAVAVVGQAASGKRNGRWLLASRLEESKATSIIDFARMFTSATSLALDICGDGPAREQIESQLEAEQSAGRVKFIGAHSQVTKLVLDYAGVAGMGRVVLEAMIHGVPAVLVGYDGVKGVLDDALYAAAAATNFSGRGLASIDAQQLQTQLEKVADGSALIDRLKIKACHDADVIWNDFSEWAENKAAPVDFPVLATFVERLRATHPTSTASAYWSAEVMDALTSAVALSDLHGTPLHSSLLLLLSNFNRNRLDAELMVTRDHVGQAIHQQAMATLEWQDKLYDALLQQNVKIQEWFAEQSEKARESLNEYQIQTHEKMLLHQEQWYSALAQELERFGEQQQVKLIGSQSTLAEQLASTQEHLESAIQKQSADQRDVLLLKLVASQSALAEQLASIQEHLESAIQKQIADECDVLAINIEKSIAILAEKLFFEYKKIDKLIREEVDKIQQQAAVRQGAEITAQSSLFAKLQGMQHAIDAVVTREVASAVGAIQLQVENNAAITNDGVNALHYELKRNADMEERLTQLHEQLDFMSNELRQIYSSYSWRITWPLRVLSKRLLLGSVAKSSHLSNHKENDVNVGVNVMSASKRSSIFSRLRNLFARTCRNGGVTSNDRQKISLELRKYSLPSLADKVANSNTSMELVAAEHQADVFVWCVIDWHFRTQRPQHLAAALAAKGHRVFYISNNFVDSSVPGFVSEPLDDSGRLYQINLHVDGAPQIYFGMPAEEQRQAIRASLSELLEWTRTTASVSLVQHPYWLDVARSLPNMRLVYDCMDHHGGFENNASSVLDAERTLVEESDLLIVTSQWLMDEMSPKARSIAMIRNATEYEHFSSPPEKVFRDENGRKVVGYYGAIAEWFDIELVRQAAQEHADKLFVLIGNDTAGAEKQLADLPNVTFTGEVPYAKLPYWLHGFDVCLLPFKVIELTLATNPVKVYEYLSAGKPVVSVDLPEMTQFEGLVQLANSPESFSAAISDALQSVDLQSHEQQVAIRQAFAARQTWDHRAADLDKELMNIPEPRVSVVVLCYNNITFTRACLDSLEKYSDYPNLEIIAVDNASTDETPQELKAWAAAAPNRIHIANDKNLGFSAGNNVGLAAATGDYLVILNNDTYVTPGWVRSMVNHLRRNPEAGLVGPVTNNIGNEARIEIAYSTMEEMIEVAGEYTRKHAGITFPIATAAFFCVMLTRKAYETVGPMDEAFGIGFFEDDDYCRRLTQHGFQILCADDVFIHHHLSASFDKLKAEAKQKLFETNRAIYEAKWGSWVPHVYRQR